MLRGKKVLLGVTGSIAAYKSAFLVRLLVTAGAEVKVIMTSAAKEFITPLTLGTLSCGEVFSSFVDEEKEGVWNNHVDLGLWADFMIIAPASANTLSKMATGHCDNLLLAVYLSARCPVFVAPAMDVDMMEHKSTSENISQLLEKQVLVIEAETGELASGLSGKGRMSEPENIITFLENYYLNKAVLKDKRVLITAGPTYEPIDPVRFIGNRSSGKMGFALAHVAHELGASVRLISGPTSENLKEPKIDLKSVFTAEEMYNVVKSDFNNYDLIIMAAAVSDFTPTESYQQKIKKKDQKFNSIGLKPTVDILKFLGENKSEKTTLVGFALETDNELSNAQQKLRNKNLDFIVLNSLKDKNAGFGGNQNKITIIDSKNNIHTFELKEKTEVAKDIFNCILNS